MAANVPLGLEMVAGLVVMVAVGAVESGLSARAHYSLLGALLIATGLLAPLATAAALRIALE